MPHTPPLPFEVGQHRAQRGQRKARIQAAGERAIAAKGRDQEIAAAVAELLGGR